MSMSVDRLLAVMFPVASLTWRSAKKATCVCALVWLLAFAGTLYAYLFSILSCLYFFLPLVVTLVNYSTIIYVLTTKNNHLKTSSDKRSRAVIMAVSVLMEFVVCFAPTNGILFTTVVRLATRRQQ
ncbi:hypothetical protein QQF64_026125 [Cirrhinus molitorella]|uniref:G-protein coupled receptors family 1 profile domain-containing protein n=1 Tax=Cirrhinus molitorella TaxID=172907 RepID=A0ABR3NQY8_9TELE